LTYTRIAVATASGKAYYKLVLELKRRRIPFIVVKPRETIPLNIKVAITTRSEKDNICCPIVLQYNENEDPSIIIEKALQILRGKNEYNTLIVGIDPGKIFSIVVIGDGIIVDTRSIPDEYDTAREVSKILTQFKSRQKVIKIGNGTNSNRLILILGRILPPEIVMELVEERGTTKNIDMISNSKTTKDISSAIRISMKPGRKIC